MTATKYALVPVVATGDMRIAGAEVDKRLSVFKAADVYDAMLAKAPPFVVTDEMVERAALAIYLTAFPHSDSKKRWDTKMPQEAKNDYRQEARAAIEAVLGGGG